MGDLGKLGGEVLNIGSLGTLGQGPLDPFGKQGAKDAASQAAELQAGASGAAISEQRRQFDAIRAALAPFIQAGTNALPGEVAGASPEGFADRIKALLSPGGVLQPLVDQRMKGVQQQLAAGGLTRSGLALREAANVPTDLAMAIENQLFGRTRDLANSGQNAAVNQGTFGASAGANIGNLLTQQGSALAQGVIGGQQAQAAGTQNLINTGLTAAAIFFSDPRLKQNMAPIGQIGPLTLYEWDWIDGLSDKIGQMSIGFDAEEVEQHFPQHTARFAGFLAVDYPSLTDELKVRYDH